MIKIDDMLLQMGCDFITSNGIKVKHPSLKDISDFGEINYSNVVGVFTAKPYDYMVELDEVGKDFCEMTNYDLFLSLYSAEGIKELCKFFIPEHSFEYAVNNDSEELVLYDKNSEAIIDRLIYEEISTFVKRINMIPLNPPHDIENLKEKPFLRNMILEDMRLEKEIMARKKKNNYQSELSNNIRFLIWNNPIGYNYSNIWELKVYQFYEGIISLQKTDNYRWTMTGVYSGNIEYNKINIDDVSWLSKIKLN